MNFSSPSLLTPSASILLSSRAFCHLPPPRPSPSSPSSWSPRQRQRAREGAEMERAEAAEWRVCFSRRGQHSQARIVPPPINRARALVQAKQRASAMATATGRTAPHLKPQDTTGGRRTRAAPAGRGQTHTWLGVGGGCKNNVLLEQNQHLNTRSSELPSRV